MLDILNEIMTETHEDDESRKARIAKLDSYESLTDREDLILWLDTHPDRSPDLCHVFGSCETRAAIDQMYTQQEPLHESEALREFERLQWVDFERNYSK